MPSFDKCSIRFTAHFKTGLFFFSFAVEFLVVFIFDGYYSFVTCIKSAHIL